MISLGKNWRAELRSHLRKVRPTYERFFRPKPVLRPDVTTLVQQLGDKGIFLFSFGRSGTTIFADFLASHPQIVTRGEVLNEDAFYNFLRKSRHRAQVWRPSVRAHAFYRFLADEVRVARGRKVLFDLKIESLHLSEGNWRNPGQRFAIFDQLLQSACPVILLRRDPIARYVSLQVALARGVFHSFEKTHASSATVTSIDLDALAANARSVQAQYAAIETAFAAYPHFCVLDYEDLFEVGPGNKDSGNFSTGLSQQLARLLKVDDAFDPRPVFGRAGGSDPLRFVSNREAVEAFRVHD